MSRAILFINPNKEQAKTLALEIVRELELKNFKTDTFVFDRDKKIMPDGVYDIAFSLGGDGTVLNAARVMAPLNVPVFAINFGTVGFLTAVNPNDWIKVFDAWLKKETYISKRLMLEARIESPDKEAVKLHCLNEVMISASGIAKIILLHVFSCANNGALMSLGQYRADGLILATPTGSTAHSVAAGGPILDPEMEAFILNPICPFTLSYRPTVHSAAENLMVEVDERRVPVILTVDGKETVALKQGDRVYISRSPLQAEIIAYDRSVFYHALKTKLSWLDTPEEKKGSHA